MTKLYYTADGNEVLGPVSQDELKRLVRSGQLGKESHFCIEGEEEWSVIGEVYPEWFIKTAPPPPNLGGKVKTSKSAQKTSEATYLETDAQFEAGATLIEKDEPTGRHASGDANESTRSKGGIDQIGEFRVIKPLEVSSGEADLYLVSREDEQYVLKLYRYGIKPKEELLAKIKDINARSVVRVYEFDTWERRAYEVQEYIPHGSLGDMVKMGGLAEPRCREVLRELAEALEDLHYVDILHRDIKPANILIRSLEPLDIVLSDFGISSVAELSLHQTSMSRTVGYSAPEALSGTISKASDWWSVGMVMLELMSGRRAFEGMSEAQVNLHLISRDVVVPGSIPVNWQRIIKGLLTRDYVKRWGVEQVKGWIEGREDIAIHYGEGDILRQADKSEGVKAGRAYQFEGVAYWYTQELAVVLGEAKNWADAVKHLERGYIQKWVENDVLDHSLANTLTDIRDDEELDKEEKLALCLMVMNKQMPLIYRGNVVNQVFLSQNLEVCRWVMKSRLPGWLTKIRGDDWLENLRDGNLCLSEMGSELLDLDLGLKLLLAEPESVMAEAATLRERFVSKEERLDFLFEKENLTREEAVILLSAKQQYFISKEEYENIRKKLDKFNELCSHFDIKDGEVLKTLEEYNKLLERGKTSDLYQAKKLIFETELTVSANIDQTESGAIDVKCLKKLEGHSKQVYSLAISADVRRIVSGSWDNTLRIWDMESGLCLYTMKEDIDPVGSVVISPDGRRIVSGSDNGTLRIWDMESGLCLKTLVGHTNHFLPVVISPDGRRIVSGSWDRTLRIWDMENGQCLKILEGHTAGIPTVVISTDGRRIVSGSRDKTLRIWDLENGQCLKILEGHTDGIPTVVISTDGRRIVSVSGDHTLRIWGFKMRVNSVEEALKFEYEIKTKED